jgi:hypothetical protein
MYSSAFSFKQLIEVQSEKEYYPTEETYYNALNDSKAHPLNAQPPTVYNNGMCISLRNLQPSNPPL